jgi:hypothetical protein
MPFALNRPYARVAATLCLTTACATAPGEAGLDAGADARATGDAATTDAAGEGQVHGDAAAADAAGLGPDAAGITPDAAGLTRDAAGITPDAAPPPPPPPPPGEFPAGAVSRVLTARPVAGAVTVDGRLEEWSATQPVSVSPDAAAATGGRNWDVAGDADLSAAVAVQWTPDALFVAARVVDDDPLSGDAAPGAFWETDSVSLYFDLDAGRAGSAFVEGDGVVALLARDGTAWLRLGGPGGASESPAEGVEIRTARTAVGYDLEARIPAALLGRTLDQWPSQVGFTLLLGDPGPGASQLMWVGSGDDQSTWGTLALEGHDGPPPDPDPDPDPEAPPTLDDLFNGRAHFAVDQDPALAGAGHREAFAVERADVGPGVVYLYHRCFLPGHEASICLSLSRDGGDTWGESVGEVIAPTDDHIFSVAPTVTTDGRRWYMVYEESNVAAAYWADSDDGLTWRRRGELIGHGAPGTWDSGAISTPGVFRDADGSFHVFYAAFPTDGRNMEIGEAAGPSLEALGRVGPAPIFQRPGAGWDAGQVSMPRVVREGAWYYLFYEGADRDFTCEVANRYGWGVARSQDLRGWARYAGNPVRVSDQAGVGCGSDMPQPFLRSDGHVFVFRTSGDASRVVREVLVR